MKNNKYNKINEDRKYLENGLELDETFGTITMNNNLSLDDQIIAIRIFHDKIILKEKNASLNNIPSQNTVSTSCLDIFAFFALKRHKEPPDESRFLKGIGLLTCVKITIMMQTLLMNALM